MFPGRYPRVYKAAALVPPDSARDALRRVQSRAAGPTASHTSDLLRWSRFSVWWPTARSREGDSNPRACALARVGRESNPCPQGCRPALYPLSYRHLRQRASDAVVGTSTGEYRSTPGIAASQRQTKSIVSCLLCTLSWRSLSGCGVVVVTSRLQSHGSADGRRRRPTKKAPQVRPAGLRNLAEIPYPGGPASRPLTNRLDSACPARSLAVRLESYASITFPVSRFKFATLDGTPRSGRAPARPKCREEKYTRALRDVK